MKRAERLHALTEALRRSGSMGCTAERLAREFCVSLRTIKRDIDALESSGVPIWSRPGPGGGYGVSARSHLPPITLSPAQAVALLAAVSAADDAPYADSASAGVRKIMDVLDPRTRAKADQLARRIWIDADRPAARVVKSALEEAMAEQRVVRIRYTSRMGDETTRDVEPVIFASTNGHWYLVGWCRLRNEMRWFLISRIEHAAVTKAACGDHDVEEIGTPPPTARSLHAEERQVRTLGSHGIV